MTQPVAVVEVIAAPYAVTEVIAQPAAGTVQVIDKAGILQPVPAANITVMDVISSGPRGPQGAVGDVGGRGPVGPPGPPGPPGASFEQHFAVASTRWEIHHDLGTYPTVTCFDLTGEQVSATVWLPDKDTVVVTFDIPFAGTAILKA